MDEQVRVICAYSTHISWLDQEARLRFTRHRRVVSRSWFTLSVWPLDWGWMPEDRLTEAPTRRAKLPPEGRRELGHPVREDICGKFVETEDVVEDQFRSLPGRGEFSKWNEMGQLAKPIDDGEENSVAF